MCTITNWWCCTRANSKQETITPNLTNHPSIYCIQVERSIHLLHTRKIHETITTETILFCSFFFKYFYIQTCSVQVVVKLDSSAAAAYSICLLPVRPEKVVFNEQVDNRFCYPTNLIFRMRWFGATRRRFNIKYHHVMCVGCCCWVLQL